MESMTVWKVLYILAVLCTSCLHVTSHRQDGGWSSWSSFSACTLSCGGGTQVRSRTCTNPSPLYGGRICPGMTSDKRSCNTQQCPVNGQWTNWSSWSQCSKTCGGGTRSRTRSCTNPPSSNGGAQCPGLGSQTKICDISCGIKVDGGWSSWSSFSPCTLSCAGGTQVRSRLCSNPFPRHGGQICPGRYFEKRSCNTQQCPVNGQWTNWSSWSQCSKTCGGGTRSRTRSCTNPPSSNGGAQCPGLGSQTKICDISCGIKVDGGWSSWSSFSPCTLSCAGGTQVRSRLCSNPFPRHGGQICPGRYFEKRSCNTQQCPVNGQWTNWSSWSQCSKTCGGGTRSRTRSCTNPPSSNGGAQCPGLGSQTKICDISCGIKVDGGWSSWSSFSPCTLSCAGGTQVRSRLCSNPFPRHGGQICPGRYFEKRSCNTQQCPVNGQWTNWSSWSQCSKTCGGGTRSRTRSCTNPPSSNGGAQCPGLGSQTKICDISCGIKVDGGWSSWSSFSPCTLSCAGGTQVRSRLCSNPFPRHGGQICPGRYFEKRSCNTQQCPVNGQWTNWSSWSQCSKTCGGGTRSRTRSCTNPPSSNGGAQCPGLGSQTKICDISCGIKVDGGWSSWSSFSPCTLSCAGGTQVRSRLCSNPFPRHGGQICPGRYFEKRSCNTQQCPVNGQWTNWSSWSQCSKTCGGGTRSRTRSCTNPPSSNGGAQCPGLGSQTKICDISCGIKVDGGWSSWSSFSPCTLSCAGGTQVRSRLCSNPFPRHGGQICPGRYFEKRSCNTQQCPVDGGWSSWSSFSPCTLSCAGGTQVRSRLCSNPFPRHGGQICPGRYFEKRSCNTQQCPGC